MTDKERIDLIFKIVEKDLLKRELNRVQIYNLNKKVADLIGEIEESSLKKKVSDKLEAKRRYGPYINDTGILDFTGYGEHLQ